MKSYFHSGNFEDSYRIIHTASRFARENLLFLQETGSLKAQKTHDSQRQNIDSYLFFVVKSGSGIVEYDGQTHSLETGDCCFLDCQKYYRHRTSEDLWSLQWVHFSGKRMEQIYNRYVQRGGSVTFSPYETTLYLDILDNLYQAAQSDSPIKDMQINEKLSCLLTLLMGEGLHDSKINRNGKKQELEYIKTYIDEHYAEKISLSELAGRHYMNEQYLTRIFKRQFGVSLYTYVLQMRITQAKKYLRYSEMTMEEISNACGMQDSNYFSRVFRKYEGMPPGEYRKKW